MENIEVKESDRQGKLLIMQLLLDLEDIKFFIIEDLYAEKGSDQSERFSPLYLSCIERYNAAEKFMNEKLKSGIYTMINDSHRVYLEYQSLLGDESDSNDFWNEMDSEYIQKFTDLYNDINEEFKIS